MIPRRARPGLPHPPTSFTAKRWKATRGNRAAAACVAAPAPPPGPDARERHLAPERLPAVDPADAVAAGPEVADAPAREVQLAGVVLVLALGEVAVGREHDHPRACDLLHGVEETEAV